MIRLWVLTILFSVISGDKEIAARTGTFIGEEKSYRSGVKYWAFEGIKFAQADRFKEAKLLPDSNERIEAKRPGPACLQVKSGTRLGKEDCLYLNLYSPKENITGKPLPVIVYIHGGRFLANAAITRPEYFMETKRVIFISLQHRLNMLGFLDFASDQYPSNLGLRDILLGLTWVQQNVANFGGDPTKVTIQGLSSGGVVANLLMHSPLSQGLFRAGISESGTACSPNGLVPPATARRTLNRVSALAGCPTPSEMKPADNVAECLLSKSEEEIADTLRKYASEGNEEERTDGLFTIRPYQPVIEPKERENAFLTFYPFKESVKQVPWLTGITSFEGYKLLNVFGISNDELLKQRNFSVLPTLFLYRDTSTTPDDITDKIKEKYLGGISNPSDAEILVAYDKLLSDNNYNFPMVQCLNVHSGSPSWTYFFAYQRDGLRNQPGLAHTGEVEYLYPKDGFDLRLNGSERDSAISERLVQLFVSFAETGVSGDSETKWDPWTKESRNSLIIDNDGIRNGPLPLKDRIDFWLNLPLRDML